MVVRLWITEDGEGYTNLRTTSWALTSDTAHLENKYSLTPTNSSTSSEKPGSAGTNRVRTLESSTYHNRSKKNSMTEKNLKRMSRNRSD